MKRILTGAILIAVVLALVFSGIPWLITAFSAVLPQLAAREFRSITANAHAPAAAATL